MSSKYPDSYFNSPSNRRRSNTFPLDEETINPAASASEHWDIVRLGPLELVAPSRSPDNESGTPQKPLSLLSSSAPQNALVHRPRTADARYPGHSRRNSMGAMIPHTPWNVVLHSSSRGRAVLYNPNDRKMVVRRAPRSPLLSPPLENQGFCMLCRRPWSNTPAANEQQPHRSNFIDSEYFHILETVTPEIVEDTDDNLLEPMDSDHVDLDASGVGDSKEEESSSSKGGLHERSFNQGYYDRFFVEESKLGRGQRGSVFLCQHVLDQVPLGQFAVKAIPVGSSHTWLVRMLKEVHLLERLRHPNIIEYKHAWLEHRQLTKFGPEIPCLFILMELANGGNLEEFVQIQWQPASVASAASSDEDEFSDMSRYSPKERIKRLRNRQRRRQQRQQEQQSASYHQQVACATSPDLKTEISSLTSPSANMSNGKSVADTQGGIGKGYLGKKVRFLREDEIWALFLDICNGLAHLHKHGIVHRDLKPPNLLLHYADPNERDEIPRVLISDFGECEVVSDTTYRERTGATGTLEFMPPELLLKSPTGQYVCTDHSPKADMWSLGVVLYFLCFARVPYTQVEDVDQLKEEIVGFDRIGELPETPRVGEGLRRCIKGLLKRDPRERWSVEQVLAQHSVDRTANIGRSRPGDSPMAGMSKAFDEPAERQLRTVVRKLTLEDVKAQATPFPSAETDGFS